MPKGDSRWSCCVWLCFVVLCCVPNCSCDRHQLQRRSLSVGLLAPHHREPINEKLRLLLGWVAIEGISQFGLIVSNDNVPVLSSVTKALLRLCSSY